MPTSTVLTATEGTEARATVCEANAGQPCFLCQAAPAGHMDQKVADASSRWRLCAGWQALCWAPELDADCCGLHILQYTSLCQMQWGIGFGEGHASVLPPSCISCDCCISYVSEVGCTPSCMQPCPKHRFLSKSYTATRPHVTIHKDRCTCSWVYSGSDCENKLVGDILLLASSTSSGGTSCSDDVGLCAGSGVALAASSALDFTSLRCLTSGCFSALTAVSVAGPFWSSSSLLS